MKYIYIYEVSPKNTHILISIMEMEVSVYRRKRKLAAYIDNNNILCFHLIHFIIYNFRCSLINIDAAEIDEKKYVFGNHLFYKFKSYINLKMGIFFWRY